MKRWLVVDLEAIGWWPGNQSAWLYSVDERARPRVSNVCAQLEFGSLAHFKIASGELVSDGVA